jgi:hypothetical protein
MATSGNYTFNLSRDDIVNQAAIKAGLLDPESGSLTILQRSNATLNLNTMITSWQADGLQIWKRLIVPITLIVNDGQYSLGPSGVTGNLERPIRILDGYIRQTAGGNDTPIKVLTLEEYNRFGMKTTSGLPTQVFYHPVLTNGQVYLYPVPTVADTLYLEMLYPYQNFVAGNDTADFPTEWLNALVYGLAVELAYDYGVETKRLSKIEARAEYLHRQALATSQEDHVYFQPDWAASGGFNYGR